MKRIIYTVFISLLMACGAIAQQDSVDSAFAKRQQDSIARARINSDSMRNLIQQVAQRTNQRLRERYQEQLATTKQNQLYNNIRAVYQRTRDYLKRGVDTARIEMQLNDTDIKTEIAGDGIFVNQGSIQTARNIATSTILLRELANRNEDTKKDISKYLRDLTEFREQVDSLASDSLLFHIPRDTAATMDFLQRIANYQVEFKPVDSQLNAAIKKVRLLSSRADILGGNIESRLEDMESFHNSISANSLSKEVTYFWETPPPSRDLSEIAAFSLKKMQLVLIFYLRNHSGKLFLLGIGFLLLSAYLRSLRRNIIDVMGDGGLLSRQLTIEHPYLTSLLIIISVGQFIFPEAPFAFYALMWTIATIALMLIHWKHISHTWRRYWIYALIHFFLACFFNIILQASRTERLLMLIFSISSLVAGFLFIRSGEKQGLRDKRIQIFVWLFILMEAIALFTNLAGRYNLSKSMFTSGHFNLIVGILLLWTIRFLHEIFLLSAEAYREENKTRFHIDFTRLSQEFPTYLYYLLGAGWFVLVGRNFYVYRQITDPIIEFFTNDRKIGAFSFSFASILLFILIIGLSTLAAKFVSYFVDGNQAPASGRRNGLGNWMLLIRIGIITLGTFLAFAATGIPFDRVAIVFGALSVGIGFGLQNLVNNLVSGLIIAFEKPLNVGDIVQVGTQTGTMKSIGFRSSVISTFEGSDVVIPNGELLNQHLINWTLNTTARRVEVVVGVNYNTDLDKAMKLIKGLMQSDARIHSNPESMILVREFSNSSIDLRILFWVDNRDNWPLVRSDLMRNIKKNFEEHNIEIPYPQMVLHQHSNTPDPTWRNDKE